MYCTCKERRCEPPHQHGVCVVRGGSQTSSLFIRGCTIPAIYPPILVIRSPSLMPPRRSRSANPTAAQPLSANPAEPQQPRVASVLRTAPTNLGSGLSCAVCGVAFPYKPDPRACYLPGELLGLPDHLRGWISTRCGYPLLNAPTQRVAHASCVLRLIPGASLAPGQTHLVTAAQHAALWGCIPQKLDALNRGAMQVGMI